MGERSRDSEDIPSYKDLVEKKKPPRIVPEGVKFKKKWVIRGFGYVFLALILLGIVFYAYGSASAPKVKYVVVDTWSDSWTIQPGHTWHQEWSLSQGALLEINITVKGGNNDLKVFIDTPSGRVDYGKLVSPIHILVNASRYGAGKYMLYWDNSFSVVTAKQISVREAAYKGVLDTSDKALYEGLGIILVVIGSISFLAALAKRAIIEVDNDVIQVDLKSGWLRYYVELKVNGFKLDQKVTGALKFRVGKDNSHVLELEPQGWLNYNWVIKIDGQIVGRLP